MLRKIAYTTGDVARICSVTINTVVKWFETGSLKGYKIPGSGARRIPHENLLEFMKKHGMPLRGLDRKGYKALLVTADAEVLKAFADALDEEKEVSLLSTADAIQAGLLVARERPDIVFADLQAPGVDGRSLVRAVVENPETRHARLVALTTKSGRAEETRVRKMGFHDRMTKPPSAGSIKLRLRRQLKGLT